MGRFIGDEAATLTPADNLGKPIKDASEETRQQMIEADRVRQRMALQEEAETPNLVQRFLNPALNAVDSGIEKIDNFYKETEQNYTALIDFAGSAVTGNERLTLEDTYKVSPGQAIEANIEALFDDSVRLADDDWRESQWGVSNRNPLDDDFNVNYSTGALDFAVDWYLDPLVLGSKFTKVTFRYGIR